MSDRDRLDEIRERWEISSHPAAKDVNWLLGELRATDRERDAADAEVDALRRINGEVAAERDAARTALHHLAPWAMALLDAGLVRDPEGWGQPGEPSAIWYDATSALPWAMRGGRYRHAWNYPTEEEAARAWLAAQGGDRG